MGSGAARRHRDRPDHAGGPADLPASEDPQDQAAISVAEAFTAAARRQPPDALRHALVALAHKDALGISSESLRWAWPLAARSRLRAARRRSRPDLVALLDAYQPGHIAPMLRAERDLARARLAAAAGAEGAAAAFAAAIASLREHSTPYHLTHGLLDHARYLLRQGDADAAEAAVGEALDIARNLCCQPLLDRAANITSAQSPVQA